MKVWVVEVCQDDEYGCMELFGIYRTEKKAHKAAKKAGFQNKEHGEDYAFQPDYYNVSECEVE